MADGQECLDKTADKTADGSQNGAFVNWIHDDICYNEMNEHWN